MGQGGASFRGSRAPEGVFSWGGGGSGSSPEAPRGLWATEKQRSIAATFSVQNEAKASAGRLAAGGGGGWVKHGSQGVAVKQHPIKIEGNRKASKFFYSSAQQKRRIPRIRIPVSSVDHAYLREQTRKKTPEQGACGNPGSGETRRPRCSEGIDPRTETIRGQSEGKEGRVEGRVEGEQERGVAAAEVEVSGVASLGVLASVDLLRSTCQSLPKMVFTQDGLTLPLTLHSDSSGSTSRPQLPHLTCPCPDCWPRLRPLPNHLWGLGGAARTRVFPLGAVICAQLDDDRGAQVFETRADDAPDAIRRVTTTRSSPLTAISSGRKLIATQPRQSYATLLDKKERRSRYTGLVGRSELASTPKLHGNIKSKVSQVNVDLVRRSMLASSAVGQFTTNKRGNFLLIFWLLE